MKKKKIKLNNKEEAIKGFFEYARHSFPLSPEEAEKPVTNEHLYLVLNHIAYVLETIINEK